MNENEKTCVYCGQVLDEGNVYEFHGKTMCEGCFNEHTAVYIYLILKINLLAKRVAISPKGLFCRKVSCILPKGLKR